ncbi:MAG: alginate export family protein [Oceanospirillaceae bacterium]|nr:alginate export family protein [Oceanospirillaceae bacterium]MCP5349700.1 alginate export family protein [Oceanospirillaceae bacterium]
MKYFTPALLACAVTTASGAWAEAASLEEAISGGTAKLNLRYRLENVNQDAKDSTMANTLQTRLNFTTQTYNGLSAVLEFDQVSAIADDNYNSSPTAATSNGKTNYAVVADQEGTDLNQAKLIYTRGENTLVLGRQAVNLGDQRFVGTVGWRQNEQTYDALAAVTKAIPDTTVVYAYVANVNRIDYSDIHANTHVLSVVNNKLPYANVEFLALLLDATNAADLSSDTLALNVKGKVEGLNYDLGYAQQSGAYDNPKDYDANYTRIEVGYTLSGINATIGQETLGADKDVAVGFATPLATMHKFQGWADQFLSTPDTGVEDTYLQVSGKVSDYAITAVYHQFASVEKTALTTDDYGTELDLSVATKLGKNYGALIKAAQYTGDANGAKNPDVSKVWLQLTASF